MAKVTNLTICYFLILTIIRRSVCQGSNLLPLFESFKDEAGSFFSNLFSSDGLNENFNKISNSIEVWRETLSGKRGANSAEGPGVKKGKFTFSNIDSSDQKVAEYITTLNNNEVQVRNLELYELQIDHLSLRENEKQKIREDNQKLKTIFSEGISQYSNRRSLAGVDVINSKYIIYEGVTTDKDGKTSTSYVVTVTSCSNTGGTLQSFTETFYYGNGYRINKDGYDLYSPNTANYCTSTATTRSGGWCRKDRKGNTCSEYIEITCQIHVTNPDFTKPGRDKSYDSNYYTYSIPGYDPCHWIDKNQVVDITYNIKGYNTNYTTMSEHWGINYDSATTPTITYTYEYNDAAKKLVLSTFSPYKIELRIVNWKWFTKYITFSDSISTFAKLTGDENGVIKVDFSKIEGSDSENYQVGGRVHLYFSMADSYWFNFNSYGYFFEINGWSEPKPKLNVIFIVTVVLVSAGVIAFAALVVYCYCRRSYNYKKMMKAAEENS